MKPTAPLRNESSVFATTSCRGLSLLHILTYTKHIPPEKKKQLRIIAVIQMTVGATMAMWPWMVKIVEKGPPY